MSETKTKQEVTRVDIAKHYVATSIIFILIFYFSMFCPPYANNITNENIDYSVILGFFAIGYILFAPIVYLVFKPKTILESISNNYKIPIEYLDLNTLNKRTLI